MNNSRTTLLILIVNLLFFGCNSRNTTQKGIFSTLDQMRHICSEAETNQDVFYDDAFDLIPNIVSHRESAIPVMRDYISLNRHAFTTHSDHIFLSIVGETGIRIGGVSVIPLFGDILGIGSYDGGLTALEGLEKIFDGPSTTRNEQEQIRGILTETINSQHNKHIHNVAVPILRYINKELAKSEEGDSPQELRLEPDDERSD